MVLDPMAAPADMPEFVGDVVAVQTAPFWSDELGAIDAKRWLPRSLWASFSSPLAAPPPNRKVSKSPATRPMLKHHQAPRQASHGSGISGLSIELLYFHSLQFFSATVSFSLRTHV
jgi:hypothetical protein